ncbi:MAG: hypothetical protein A2Y62_07465 [Candidatus Fischerbacteria bacterium RBG_13_37_8]|uniref:HTH asnC-type domain-containing protein n=1 Tax=Candidatus Fischerbacteria bacterium RBG_13_37_8 TaxID=1817863 RepID=A0A1F5VIC9_9BACT|nr:MAG: hypothetical protein A2Y62_07465 [Candidatus Fischerbacteria bacterium RBG_13_37_8]
MKDELEVKIIRALNENARKSFRVIAKEIGTSVQAVIQRVKKLEEAGAIKGYIPVLDNEYFGFGLTAVIGFRITHGKLIETQESIAKDPHVVTVFDVTGEWDSIAIGHFKDREDLNEFIKKVLHSQKNVDRTVTHIVLNVVKNEHRIVI